MTSAGLALLLVACADSPQSPRPAAPTSSALVLDPAQHSVGSTIGDQRLAQLDAARSSVDPGVWVGSATFVGTTKLSGSYGPHPAYPELEVLCFFPDSLSANRLPRFPEDQRNSWLCFSNQQEATSQLAPPASRGTATVVVDDFHYVFEPSDVNNSARLVQVIKKSPATVEDASSNPSLQRTPPG